MKNHKCNFYEVFNQDKQEVYLECNCGEQKEIKERLEYLRGEIKAERISYGEIAELQSLKKYIEAGDVELLEWAGVKES